jgi:protein-tyrosine phosphatase
MRISRSALVVALALLSVTAMSSASAALGQLRSMGPVGSMTTTSSTLDDAVALFAYIPI